MATIDELAAACKRVKWNLIAAKQELFAELRVGLALSAGSTKGPIHIGVLEYADDNSIPIHEINCNSVGAVVGAPYMVLRKDYLEHPKRFDGLRGPAHKLEHIVLENPNILKHFGLISIFREEGIIDTKPIEEFLKRILDDRTFNDVPGLYILTFDAESRQNIVFGEVRKYEPIWRAVMASIAIPGTIEPLKDDSSFLFDPSVLRKSPLRVIYEHKGLTLRVCVFLGYHTKLLEVYKKIKPDDEVSTFGVLIHPKRRFIAKRDYVVEMTRVANAERERFDLNEDIPEILGRRIEDVINGQQRGLILVLPDHDYVEFTNPTQKQIKDLIQVGYNAAAESFRKYNEAEPNYLRFLRNVKFAAQYGSRVLAPYS